MVNDSQPAGTCTSDRYEVALLHALVALKKGDFSVRLPLDWTGLPGKIADAFNDVAEANGRLAQDIETAARRVGKEGKLSQRLPEGGESGAWAAQRAALNSLLGDLILPAAEVARVIGAVARGDLSQCMALEVEGRPLEGEFLHTARMVNAMVDQLASFTAEVTRVAREVGTEGKLGGQAEVTGAGGVWKDLTDSVNRMADNLTVQLRDVSKVATAIARGDLTQKITVDVRGEILQIKDTINTMVDQLGSFAAEVNRVAKEVGTDGKLGGQAVVQGVSGAWKELTENVNGMAANLTVQLRDVSKVATAIARGDLSSKITVEVRGEILQIKDTINTMVDQLRSFAAEVTRVAREVGTEGILGGQARVPGAAGVWQELTNNVNGLAANLTTQVRAIAEVATAVAKGDLTRSIRVEASGEVAALKDNVNEMIRNLRETTTKSAEQDWLKSNLARFTRMLQGQRDPIAVGRMILSELAPLVAVHAGAFYAVEGAGKERETGTLRLRLLATYGLRERKNLANLLRPGEGLIGQCVLEKQPILLTNVPADYIQISSGLGEGRPQNVVVVPVLFEGVVKAVVELASFERFTATHQAFFDQLAESIGIVLSTIEASMRTEELLEQSQSLTQELQTQQEELQQTNEELEEKARLLASQNEEVERKNREVELAKAEVEEKAAQLALTSKYKSEFLANMSHELRTPLNSLLILAQQLEENPDGNLTPKQVSYAQTIHASGTDLLSLINDILDLSKIESGKATVDLDAIPMPELQRYVEQTFRHVAEEKGLQLLVEFDQDLPELLYSDVKRVQQVLKNLLSNACKFTEQGRVVVRARLARGGFSTDVPTLGQAPQVLAFSVADSGIGIPPDKLQLIFEAFQQADGTTSRKYGGTGLGLSISREIARLLGGEIRVESEVGRGSTFTFYLPAIYQPMPYDGPVTAGGLAAAERGGARDDGAQSAAAAAAPAATVRSSSGGDGRRGGLIGPETALGQDAAHTVAERRSARPSAATRPTMPRVPDDREVLTDGDRVVLIVEDDVGFASVLVEAAHEQGFKALVAPSGEEALELVHSFPVTAVTLDIHLPGIDGWAVLDRLKQDGATRHLPVHVISVEEDRVQGRSYGAFAHLVKPGSREALLEAFGRIRAFIDSPVKRLLVVEDEEEERQAILDLVGNGDVQATAVGSGQEALAALSSGTFDCMVLDLRLPDISGFEVLDRMRQDPAAARIPVIIYTGRDLTARGQAQLEKRTRSVIIKNVRSPERLLEETALFLHRVEANLPEPKRQMLQRLRRSDIALAGKKVLLVDDDIRNIFALTSVLERQGMVVQSAENGKAAIETLRKKPEIDVVLMDIMMPEMDGYETTRAIRKMSKLKGLPIIALTAKAMKGDREKCLEAGASDYITKPVDTDQLLSLLRVWLHR